MFWSGPVRNWGRRAGLTAALLGALAAKGGPVAVESPGGQAGGKWSPVLSLSVDEYYDSNVYTYEFGEIAGQDSMVTVIEPEVGALWSDKDDEPSEFRLSYHPRITWKVNRHLTATAGYTYQWVESDIAATPAREYYRNEVRLGFKTAF